MTNNEQQQCMRCNAIAKQNDQFCSKCGKKFSKNAEISDFEIGRIAALDTIKGDILKWFGLLSLVLGILALFGINEILKSSVNSAVTLQTNELKSDLEKAAIDSRVLLALLEKEQQAQTNSLRKTAEKLKKNAENAKKTQQQIKNEADLAAKTLEHLTTAEVEVEVRLKQLNESNQKIAERIKALYSTRVTLLEDIKAQGKRIWIY